VVEMKKKKEVLKWKNDHIRDKIIEMVILLNQAL
jgi:hypothetical protein